MCTRQQISILVNTENPPLTSLVLVTCYMYDDSGHWHDLYRLRCFRHKIGARMSPYTGFFSKRPQIITARKRNLGQRNVFTSVCDSVQRGGGVADTPSRQTPQADTLYADTPLPARQTTPGRLSRQTPPRQAPSRNQEDSHRSGWYASYWNAFLLRIFSYS